ncbi:MAG: formyltetrahydrofolate deformylase [Verrucomicrobiota bacterium]|nr:formyltetrahydrofolate deformylase [Verrucomicrobiota bacterium]
MKQFATITVIGKDKTGVIAGLTNFLFEQKANIEALEEQVTRGQFSMVLQASWLSGQLNEPALRRGLADFSRQYEMEVSVRLTEPHRLQRAAIFVTREPHCLQALLPAFKQGKLKAVPGVVISNRKDLAGIVRDHGLPFKWVNWEDRQSAEERTVAILDEHEIDFLILARFMKILGPTFVWRYKNKIINIHPSLLPSFPGPQAYRQAYEHGVKIIGVTAHFVSMHLDEGPIIAQESFPFRPGMTLKEIMQRGQSLESKALIKAVRLYLSKRLDVYWGTVKEV